jgi:hypothetical protein
MAGLSKEQRLWLGLIYMAYYNDGSAWHSFTRPGVADRRQLPPLNYPISYQRRNLFGGRIARHFESIYAIRSLTDWLAVDSWSGLLRRLNELYGNGRWASYTTAELLVGLGLSNVRPDSYEVEGSSGPVSGLNFLGLPGTLQAAKYIHRTLTANGVRAPDEIFESFLCNWSRMNKADFYVGSNIDRQQNRIEKVERITGSKLKPVWQTRLRVLDNRTLGELHGWRSDRDRAKIYAATKRVLTPWQHR